MKNIFNKTELIIKKKLIINYMKIKNKVWKKMIKKNKILFYINNNKILLYLNNHVWNHKNLLHMILIMKWKK